MKRIKQRSPLPTPCTCYARRSRGGAPVCPTPGARYFCRGCRRFVPVCFGAADEHFELCDNCYASATTGGA